MKWMIALMVGLLLGVLVPAAAGDKYLAWLIQARASHFAWAEYYRAHPEARSKTITLVACTGDVTYQMMWVRRYDALIREWIRR